MNTTITNTATMTAVEKAEDADRIASAVTTLTEREAALAAAVEHREALRERLRCGDDTVTTPDLQTAATEVERLTPLVAAAERAVSSAQRVKRHDPELAEIIAPTLASVLRVPVHIVRTVPTEAPEIVPAVYLRQSRPAVADHINGTLGGEVEVTFARTDMHLPVNPRLVGEKLDDAGVRLGGEPIAWEGPGFGYGVVSDVMALTIRSATAEMPVIVGEVQLFEVSGFARGLASDIHRNLPRSAFYDHGVHVQEGTPRPLASLHPVVDVISTDSRTTKGTRKVTVTVAIDLRPAGIHGHQWDGDAVADQGRRVVAQQLGGFSTSLGRVQSAEVVSIRPGNGYRNGRTVEARFAFVSKSPESD